MFFIFDFGWLGLDVFCLYLFTCMLVFLYTCIQGIGVASILVYLILGVYSAMHLSSINLCHLCRLFSRTESGFQKNEILELLTQKASPVFECLSIMFVVVLSVCLYIDPTKYSDMPGS